MKAYKILYLMMAFVLTIRCSNDDTIASSTNESILGDWVVAQMTISGNMTGNDSDTDWIWMFKYYPIPIQPVLENQNYRVNFSKSNEVTSHGSLKTSYVAFVDDYTTAYEYSKVIENVNVFKNGNWSIKDTFLTVTRNGLIEKFTIIELTPNKLTILKKLNDEVVLNHEAGAIDCTTNLEMYLTFQKN